jgi:hypothetical protein
MLKRAPISKDTNIIGVNKTIGDFWEWGFSDILSNSLRGIFAEFLVGSAIGCLNDKRIEWDAFDLVYQDKKIEVKSSSYIQTWHNEKHSKISFNIGAKKEYDYQLRKYSSTVKRNADIYVFCLLKEKNEEIIDPLIIDQWEFYLVLTSYLDKHFPNQKTISLASLSKISKSIKYEYLKSEVETLISEVV